MVILILRNSVPVPFGEFLIKNPVTGEWRRLRIGQAATSRNVESRNHESGQALRPAPIRAGSGPRRTPPVSEGVRSEGSDERRALLYEVARLDEDFASGDAAPDTRRRYEARRAELIRRIREL